MLEPGEYIIHQARIHPCAYISALLYFALLMTPGRLTGLASTRLAVTNKRRDRPSVEHVLAPKTRPRPNKHIVEVAIAQRGKVGRRMTLDYGTLHRQRQRRRAHHNSKASPKPPRDGTADRKSRRRRHIRSPAAHRRRTQSRNNHSSCAATHPNRFQASHPSSTEPTPSASLPSIHKDPNVW